MGPRRARANSGKAVTQEDFHALNELWKAAKRHGMEAALQKLAGEPVQQPDGRAPKRQRKVPVRYREGQ